MTELFETTRDFCFGLGHPEVKSESLNRTLSASADLFDGVLGRARDAGVAIRRDYQGDALVEKLEENRAEHLAHAAEVTGHRLKMLVQDADKLEGSLIGSQARRSPPEGMSEAEAAALGVDVRDVFRGMKPEDRQVAYLAAAEAGDTLTLGAIELVPATVAMIPEETISRGKEIVAKATNPEGFAALREHRLAIWSIEADLQRVERELAPAAPATALAS